MTHPQPITCPFARFAYIMEALCKVVAASHNRGWGLPAPLVTLIWKMLRRKATRFAKLAAAFQAGTLAAPTDKRRRSRTQATPATSVTPTEPVPASEPGAGIHPNSPPPGSQHPQTQPPHLPTCFAWLIKLIAGTRPLRSQLLHLLSDPQLAEFITAAPQVGRMLRGLCRTLGIKNPETYCEALRREKPPSRRKPRYRPRRDWQTHAKLPESFANLTWRLPDVPARDPAPSLSQPRPPSRGPSRGPRQPSRELERFIDKHRERRPDDPAPPTFLTVHRFSRS